MKRLVDSPSIRQVSSPLTREMLRPLKPECKFVQFDSLLSDREFKRLATLLRRHPKVTLRAYGSYDGSITNLDFLRHFPTVRSFQADVYNLESIDGLNFLPTELASLSLGQTKHQFSLQPLARFTSLNRLHLERHSKDLSVVAGLTEVTELSLRSITLTDLSLFRSLTKLETLAVKLGGTKILDGISAFPNLRYLELWMIRGFTDLGPITEVPSLQNLFLQALKNVRTMPDLSSLTQLTKIHLETMKGLTDLRPLLTARALQELWLVDMRHLHPEDVAVLAAHPTLTRARVGLGSARKNDEAMARLGASVEQR